MRSGLPAGAAIAIIAVLGGCGGAGKMASVNRSTATDTPSTESVPITAARATSAPATPIPTSPPTRSLSLAPPSLYQWPIPYGTARKREMAAYSLRHYGENTYVLSNPKVIVEHYTETPTAQEAFNTFAPDVPDNEFHELPNTCAHFLVEQSGRIDQLVSLSLRCRHTTGLNWTAIGIENVGLSDQAILDDPG